MINYSKDIDDFNRGDKIKIHLLDDAFANIYWKGKEGIIEKIDYSDNSLRGSWGKIQVYPEYDDIEILEHVELKPISGYRN